MGTETDSLPPTQTLSQLLQSLSHYVPCFGRIPNWWSGVCYHALPPWGGSPTGGSNGRPCRYLNWWLQQETTQRPELVALTGDHGAWIPPLGSFYPCGSGILQEMIGTFNWGKTWLGSWVLVRGVDDFMEVVKSRDTIRLWYVCN